MSVTKQEFRRLAVDKLPGGALRSHLSLAICRRLAALPEMGAAGHVGLYSARRSEPNIDELWHQDPHRCCFPRVTSGTLQFHPIASLSDRVVGSLRIEEPPQESPLVGFQKNDVIMVPGTRFDKKGARIGSGKGYYDRFLAALPGGVLKIGVAWSLQIEDDLLPQEPHDIRMDLICTENAVFDCRQ